MTQFDPSVLSQISDAAPDPVGARAKAYTLADLMDKEQLNKLTLHREQQEQGDIDKTRAVLKGQDISTPEGLMKASQALSKAGLPQQAMGLMKEANSARSQQQQLDEGQLQLLSMQADLIGPAALQVKGILQSQGLPAANARYQQIVSTIMPSVPQSVRQGIPAQLPNDPQQASAVLDQAIARSQQARQIIQLHTNQAKEERAQANEERAEKREERQESEEGRKERKEAQAKKEAEEGLISDDSAQLAVDRILNGEQARDVLANFGRGKQGPQNIAKVQNLLAQTAKERGISSKEITARNIELKGLTKEQQVEASISGKISYAEKEIEQIGPKVLEASEKVPRGSFVPWNKLRNMSAAQISSPELKQLKAYLNTLTNSYDVLGGRGGTDVEKRAHNRELLDAADSPQALKAAVDAIIAEAKLSHTAANESRTVDRAGIGAPPGGGAAAASDPLGIR